jgi:hypothetical protein
MAITENFCAIRKRRSLYDVTIAFCGRFLTRGDRTIDQMIQAARSGKQNILEGSKASGTSKEAEIKLTNTAGPAWKSYSTIIMIFCAPESITFGRRIAERQSSFDGWPLSLSQRTPISMISVKRAPLRS